MAAIKKLCVLGAFGVGKTSITRRYVLDSFDADYRATLGVNLYKYSDSVKLDAQSEPVLTRLILWDVEGAAEPDAHALRYMTGASGALVVGDIMRPETCDAMRLYAAAFEAKMPGRPMIFAFNKCDLLEKNADRNLLVDAPALYERFGAELLFTSALTSEGVKEAFQRLIIRLLKLNV